MGCEDLKPAKGWEKRRINKRLRELNCERFPLIERDVNGEITPEERVRLEELEAEATRLVHRLVPKFY